MGKLFPSDGAIHVDAHFSNSVMILFCMVNSFRIACSSWSAISVFFFNAQVQNSSKKRSSPLSLPLSLPRCPRSSSTWS